VHVEGHSENIWCSVLTEPHWQESHCGPSEACARLQLRVCCYGATAKCYLTCFKVELAITAKTAVAVQ